MFHIDLNIIYRPIFSFNSFTKSHPVSEHYVFPVSHTVVTFCDSGETSNTAVKHQSAQLRSNISNSYLFTIPLCQELSKTYERLMTYINYTLYSYLIYQKHNDNIIIVTLFTNYEIGIYP